MCKLKLRCALYNGRRPSMEALAAGTLHLGRWIVSRRSSALKTASEVRLSCNCSTLLCKSESQHSGRAVGWNTCGRCQGRCWRLLLRTFQPRYGHFKMGLVGSGVAVIERTRLLGGVTHIMSCLSLGACFCLDVYGPPNPSCKTPPSSRDSTDHRMSANSPGAFLHHTKMKTSP